MDGSMRGLVIFQLLSHGNNKKGNKNGIKQMNVSFFIIKGKRSMDNMKKKTINKSLNFHSSSTNNSPFLLSNPFPLHSWNFWLINDSLFMLETLFLNHIFPQSYSFISLYADSFLNFRNCSVRFADYAELIVRIFPYSYSLCEWAETLSDGNGKFPSVFEKIPWEK